MKNVNPVLLSQEFQTALLSAKIKITITFSPPLPLIISAVANFKMYIKFFLIRLHEPRNPVFVKHTKVPENPKLCTLKMS